MRRHRDTCWHVHCDRAEPVFAPRDPLAGGLSGGGEGQDQYAREPLRLARAEIDLPPGIEGRTARTRGRAFEVVASAHRTRAALGPVRRLGLEALLDRDLPGARLVVSMVAARILSPPASSRRAVVAHPRWARTRGSVADEDALYGAMDWLLARQDRIEDAGHAPPSPGGSRFLYDLSSTYSRAHPAPWPPSATTAMARRASSR